jgi:hypothetical protein
MWCACAWTYLECTASHSVVWSNNQEEKYKYRRSARRGRKSTTETWTTWTKKLVVPEKTMPPSSLSQQPMRTTRTTVRQSMANKTRRSHRPEQPQKRSRRPEQRSRRSSCRSRHRHRSSMDRSTRVCSEDDESSRVPVTLSVYDSFYSEEHKSAAVDRYAPSSSKDITFVDSSGIVDFFRYDQYTEENYSSPTNDILTDFDVPLDRFVQQVGCHLDAALADFHQLVVPEKTMPPSSLSQQPMRTTRTTVRQSMANTTRRSHQPEQPQQRSRRSSCRSRHRHRSMDNSRGACRDEESSHVPATFASMTRSTPKSAKALLLMSTHRPLAKTLHSPTIRALSTFSITINTRKKTTIRRPMISLLI